MAADNEGRAGPAPGELITMARDQAQANARARDAVFLGAGRVAKHVEGLLAQEVTIEAAVYALAQLGREDPVFRELAGFGRPLPDWADWLPPNEEEFEAKIVQRIEEILKTRRKVADRQAAEEGMGERHYRPEDEE